MNKFIKEIGGNNVEFSSSQLENEAKKEIEDLLLTLEK